MYWYTCTGSFFEVGVMVHVIHVLCTCTCRWQIYGSNFLISEMVSLFSLALGKSKEAERKRVNKELANIRSKFKGTCVRVFKQGFNYKQKIWP